jgi:yecA family protein
MTGQFDKKPRRLSKKQRNDLEALMELRDPTLSGPLQASVTRLHGFLSSVISGPLIPPSDWIPVVFRNEESGGWETMRQAQRAMDLLMRFNNEVALDLLEQYRGFSIMIDRIGDPPDAVDLAGDWCRGYVAGMSLRAEEWETATEASEITEALTPILLLADPDDEATPDPFEHPEDYAALMNELPQSAVDIYDWWRTPRTVRRSAPKISANAPCPCGSGKKYKRCCSPLREA